MSRALAPLLLGLAAIGGAAGLAVRNASVGLGSAAPKTFVNLDLPPRERFKQMAREHSKELVDYITVWVGILQQHTELDKHAWYGALRKLIADEYIEELEGIVEAVNNTDVALCDLILFNSMYEMGSPMGCSEVLMARPDGSVVHGRNLDYRVISPVLDVTFLRHGKPVYQAPLFLGQNSFHTMMKVNGDRSWTWGQNTRFGGKPSDWLQNAQKGDHQIFQYFARDLVESDVDFEGAVRRTSEVPLIRNHYFTIAGAGPYQGAIVQRAPDSTVRVKRLRQGSGRFLGTPATWHLLQTNDDGIGSLQSLRDPRRGIAEAALGLKRRRAVSPGAVLRTMRSRPLYLSPRGAGGQGTVFTSVYDLRSQETCTLLGGIAGGERDAPCDLRRPGAELLQPSPA